MLVWDDPATRRRAIEAVAKDKALTEFFKRAAGAGARAVVPAAAEGRALGAPEAGHGLNAATPFEFISRRAGEKG